jgi:hypothetical protein
MLKLLQTWNYIHTAPEHSVTRWLLVLTSLVTGATIAGLLHTLRVAGF